MGCLKGKIRAAVFLAIFLFSAAAFAYPAEVENVPSDRYFEVTLNEIQQAKSSIRLTMYLVSLPPKGAGSKVHRLLDALAEAVGRGVEVRVVLDRNAPWIEKGNKNAGAYRYLQERGVGVFYDDENVLTHAKALVIDGKTVILGSTNWSESALTRNAEANVLIRSEGLAREILAGFEEPVPPAPETGPGGVVRVPWAFLNSRNLLGRMESSHDERAFDLYLFLLKSFNGNGEGEIVLSYQAIAEGIGVESKQRYRDVVRRALNHLQNRYRLIAYAWRQKSKGLVISLKTLETSPEETVGIPSAYWEWGWSRKLTLPGKVMYLLGEMYSPLSPAAPVWFRSEEDLAKKYGFSGASLRNGLMDLRRNNLIEVEPDRLSPANYSSRKPNRYTPNPLYDPKELEKAFRELERRYGKEKLQRAMGYLRLIYEDGDAKAAERLILLEEEFGPEVVRKAAKKVGEMSGNNPKKTVGYLVATIRGMGDGSGRRNLTAPPLAQ